MVTKPRLTVISADAHQNWVNRSRDYFLLVGIDGVPIMSTSSVLFGQTNTYGGVLYSPEGNSIGFFEALIFVGNLTKETVTGGLTALMKGSLLIPPSWRLSNFSVGYGFYLTEDEVMELILNGGGA